nr:translesion DNA synthesis-associated protein ImuA [Ramlibacter aurantiacus]
MNRSCVPVTAILSAPLPAEFELPAQVWRVHELAAREEETLSTGLPALDAELPGGGWPVGQLVELLQARPQQHVWRLLLPALARAVQSEAGPVVLVAPPHPVFAPSLAAQGLPGGRLLWVKADKPPARLWSAEQALRCAEAAAVLAWLPKVEAAELRRLHLAAQQQRRLLFVFRPESARHQASPARLRLLVESGDALKVHVIKRRGPPRVTPVLLPPLHALLAEMLQARRSGLSQAQPEPTQPVEGPLTRSRLRQAQPERSRAQPEGSRAQPERSRAQPEGIYSVHPEPFDIAQDKPFEGPLTRSRLRQAQPERSYSVHPEPVEGPGARSRLRQAQPERSRAQPERSRAQPEGIYSVHPEPFDIAQDKPVEGPLTRSRLRQAQPERSYSVHPEPVEGPGARSRLRQAQPERSRAQPERSRAQPERSRAQPERNGSQPERSRAQPERNGSQPEPMTEAPAHALDRPSSAA